MKLGINSIPTGLVMEFGVRYGATLRQAAVVVNEVSFQWKNPDFLLRNPDFLLKNVDFILKTGGLGLTRSRL